MVQAWVYDEQPGVDQREPHQHSPSIAVPLSTLATVGVLHWTIDPAGCEEDPHKGDLGRVRKERQYKNHDIITVSPDKLPNYEAKIRSFFEEHLHEDEEIRFVLEGQGYFDVRNDVDAAWIRILVKAGDMIVLPAGMYHRFTLDTTNYIKVIRLFQDAPRWEAINRGDKAEATPAREQYKKFSSAIDVPMEKLYVSSNAAAAASAAASGLSSTRVVSAANGESFTLNEAGAKSIANYPHMRAHGGLLYVSGTSSRRADNTHVGATKQADGSFVLDIRAQTTAVLRNIESILAQAGATLAHVLDATVFLVDMKDYAGMNEAYNAVFNEPAQGPTRTTVAVHQLPHPNLLVEIKVVARDPRAAQH